MQLKIDHKPMSRGVTQLMYVGDVPDPMPASNDFALASIAAAVAISTKGKARLLAAGVAALLAYRGLRNT